MASIIYFAILMVPLAVVIILDGVRLRKHTRRLRELEKEKKELMDLLTELEERID